MNKCNTLLFSLDGREALATAIISHHNSISPFVDNETFIERGMELGKVNKQKFSDGELCVDFIDSVRGKRVYLLTSPNCSDEIIKLELAIDAAKRGAASEIIPILPIFHMLVKIKKTNLVDLLEPR